ncbi:hypothetical protein MTO96_015680 [Rhipicephalus appendiculatus]
MRRAQRRRPCVAAHEGALQQRSSSPEPSPRPRAIPQPAHTRARPCDPVRLTELVARFRQQRCQPLPLRRHRVCRLGQTTVFE